MKYFSSLKSIGKRKKETTLLIIQLTLSTLAFLILYHSYNYYSIKKNIYNKIIDIDKTLVNNSSVSTHGWSARENLVPTLTKLKDDGKIKEIRIINKGQSSLEFNGNYYPYYTISREYLMALNIELEEGTMPTYEELDPNKTWDYIPIIVGNKFKDQVKVGDTTTLESMVNSEDSISDYKRNFKVVGIAKAGSMIMVDNNFNNLDIRINDYGIYAPISIWKHKFTDKTKDKINIPIRAGYNEKFNLPYEIKDNEIVVYNSDFIDSIGELKFQLIVNEKDDIKAVRSLCNSIFESNNYPLRVIELKVNQWDEISLFNTFLLGTLVFSIIIFFFTIIGIGLTTLYSLDSRKKEFGVRLSQGATINKIAFLIIKENIIKVLISSFLSLIPYLYAKNILDDYYTLNTDYSYTLNLGLIPFLIVNLIITLVVILSILPAIRKLKTLNVVDLVRGKK